MAYVTYSLDIDRDIERDVRIYMEGVTREQVEGYATAVKAEVKSIIRERALAPTGELAGSIMSTVYDDDFDDAISAVVYSDLPQALWFEEGTGLHGPRSQWIMPRSHKFLWFVPRGKNTAVRASKVEGQKARHPFRDGLGRVVGRGGALRRQGI